MTRRHGYRLLFRAAGRQRGRADAALFGRRMAEMHLAEPAAKEAKAGAFGFDVPNTIGGTAQPNAWSDDWVAFYREQRIGHQVKLRKDPLQECEVCFEVEGRFERQSRASA